MTEEDALDFFNRSYKNNTQFDGVGLLIKRYHPKPDIKREPLFRYMLGKESSADMRLMPLLRKAEKLEVTINRKDDIAWL